MPRGGKRDGAGRPSGEARLARDQAIARAKITGMMPHEILLSIARGEPQDGETPTLAQRLYAASAAAPYFTPRLAQIEAKVESQTRHYVSSEPLTPDEWDRLASGVGPPAGPTTPLN